jgi:hypothetical protein
MAVEEELLARFFHNELWKAPTRALSVMSAYNFSVTVDPSVPPKERKSLVWFRDTKQELRRLMGGKSVFNLFTILHVCCAACMTGFVKKTGNGHGGPAGEDADTQFYNYCHKDPLVMFMWIHWERGTNVPAHCSATLEEGHRMDIGTGSGQGDAGLLSPRHTPSRTPSRQEQQQQHQQQELALLKHLEAQSEVHRALMAR